MAKRLAERQGMPLNDFIKSRPDLIVKMGGTAEDIFKNNTAAREDIINEDDIPFQAAAMYRSPKQDIKEFVEATLKSEAEDKSYFSLGSGFAIGKDLNIDIPSETIRHVKTEHPDFDKWSTIDSIFNNVVSIAPTPVTRYNSESYAIYSNSGNEHFGAVIEIMPSGRALVTTLFEDNPKRIKGWIKEKASRSALGRQERPRSGYRVSTVSPNNRTIQYKKVADGSPKSQHN
jgi:hypothetical protein